MKKTNRKRSPIMRTIEHHLPISFFTPNTLRERKKKRGGEKQAEELTQQEPSSAASRLSFSLQSPPINQFEYSWWVRITRSTECQPPLSATATRRTPATPWALGKPPMLEISRSPIRITAPRWGREQRSHIIAPAGVTQEQSRAFCSLLSPHRAQPA